MRRLFYMVFMIPMLIGLQADDPSPDYATPTWKSKKQQQEGCAEGPRSMRASVRYTTPRGIGYQPGYTSLEGFFSQTYQNRWTPFLDLRGHVFDNGYLAANAGLGLRYLALHRVWGINTYYDYRNTSHQHYNQVAVGLENLGVLWDVRLNGYLPVGDKLSPLRDPKFSYFAGHTMYLKSKRDTALKGANLEAGFHVDQIKSIPFYFTGGPYYLNGKGISTWGGQIRSAVDFYDRMFRVEGNLSYDHFFKWIGQGQVSVNIAFGKRAQVQNQGKGCANTEALYARTMQRIDRNEIIPVGKTHVTSAAINPATGEPYFFVFMDNTSSSLGTFESPYGSLFTAQENSSAGDIIYVFPGDGSSNNMNTGIALQEAQMLLGASTSYNFATTLGNISVPPFASSMPILTNMISEVISLSNGNTVSGIYIENMGVQGISGTAITDVTATNNYFVGGLAMAGSGEAIFLENLSGTINVNDNFFSQSPPNAGNGYVVHIMQTDASCDATLNNNTIFGLSGGSGISGIFADLSGTGSIGNLNISNSALQNNDEEGNGVLATLTGTSSLSNLSITNSNVGYWGNGLVVNVEGTGSVGNIAIANSSITGCSSDYGVELNLTSSGGIGAVNITNSNLSNNDYSISSLLSGSGSIANLNVSNCTINGSTTDAFYNAVGGSGSIVSFTISNCTIDGASDESFFLQTTGTGGITNLTVSNSTFSEADDAFYFNIGATNSIQNMTLSNSNFYADQSAVNTSGSGSIENLDVTGCNFTSNQYGLQLANTGGFTNLNVSSNIFTANSNSISSSVSINSLLIANNQFTANATGAAITLPETSSASITGNQFTGVTSTPSNGYAIGVTSAHTSDICLNFFGNSTAPTTQMGVNPYYLNNTLHGTFDLTAESTQANNVGGLHTTGTFGSCSP